MNNQGYQDGFIGLPPVIKDDPIYHQNYRQGLANRYRVDKLDEGIRFQIERYQNRQLAQGALQAKKDFSRCLRRHFEIIDRAY